MDLAAEELLLGVPARPPRQHAADVEVLAQDMPPHVLGLDPFGRALVVRAAGGMHVMVAGEPVHLGEVDPALEPERLAMRLGLRYRDRPRLDQVFRPACQLDVVPAGRQRDRLAALAIDLGMEKEIRREPAAGRRIHPAHPVAKDERGHRRSSVLVPHVEHHRHRGLALKQDVDVAAETQVLRSLTDVEADPRLALAGIARIDLDDPVLQAQARQRSLERAVTKHGHVGPALDDLGGADRLLGLGPARRRLVDRGRVRALRDKLRRDARQVVDLDQEHRPTLLHKPRRRGSLPRFDPALGVDLDADQTVFVEHALDRPDRLFLPRGIDRLIDARLVGARQRLSQQFERLDDPLDLGRQGLKLDVVVNGQIIGTAGRNRRGPDRNGPGQSTHPR